MARHIAAAAALLIPFTTSGIYSSGAFIKFFTFNTDIRKSPQLDTFVFVTLRAANIGVVDQAVNARMRYMNRGRRTM
jgi:hypothetical protein